MKKITLFVSLVLISIILSGCLTPSESQKPNSLQNDNETLLLDQRIKEVTVSESNRNSSTISENNDFIEEFRNIISSAVKENGIANTSNPTHLIEIQYEDGTKQNLDLWIGQDGEKAMLMKSDDTHTIYTISEEMSKKLINLVWERGTPKH